jgi:hypothetical protein
VRGLSIADVESGSIEKEMLWVILRFLRIATNGRTDNVWNGQGNLGVTQRERMLENAFAALIEQ